MSVYTCWKEEYTVLHGDDNTIVLTTITQEQTTTVKTTTAPLLRSLTSVDV